MSRVHAVLCATLAAVAAVVLMATITCPRRYRLSGVTCTVMRSGDINLAVIRELDDHSPLTLQDYLVCTIDHERRTLAVVGYRGMCPWEPYVQSRVVGVTLPGKDFTGRYEVLYWNGASMQSGGVVSIQSGQAQVLEAAGNGPEG